LQLRNLAVNCAKELSKPSKDLASLLVCNEEEFLGLGFQFFVDDIINGTHLGFFGQG